ncbi:MAG: hypothetical protein K8J31_01400 [Anaerolineae bacterium]|jgi:hypothetical protein|nr:hypothetical protein [Anaerolineae bacterium]
MSVTVQLLPGESILIATMTGEVNREKALEVFHLTNELIADIEGPIIRITDVSEATSSFADMINVLNASGRSKEGSTSDPRIQVILVGTSSWLRFFRDAMASAHQGSRNIPAFDNLEDALLAARNELQKLSA